MKRLGALILTLFLIFGIAPLRAEEPAQVNRVGAAIMNGDEALSFWLVESAAGDRGVVVKVAALESDQEVNVLLYQPQLKELKALCKKAFRYHGKLESGQSETIGRVMNGDMSLEVVVIRSGKFTVRLLDARQKDKLLTFHLDNFQEDSILGLITQSTSLLR